MDLAQYIYEKRLTKISLARQLDISQNYLLWLCQKKKTPSVKLAMKIIELAEGDIGLHELYPELFDCYKEARRKKFEKNQDRIATYQLDI